MSRKTILVLAYSISPVRGSEYSVGWNYVHHMSRYYDLIVLYGLAGDHMGDLQEIEGSELCRNMKGVQFVPVRPSRLANFLNYLNRKDILPYIFYLAYRVWHQQAYRQALKIIEEHRVDLVHYLCPIGFREPGYLWKLNKPYVWGPIGGVKNYPASLIFQRSIKRGIMTVLRNTVNSLQFRCNIRLHRALHRCDELLAATSETKEILERVYKVRPIYLSENAIDTDVLKKQKIVRLSRGETLRIIWVGRIDFRKALDVLLMGLARLDNNSWHLDVVGDGPEREKLQAFAAKNGLANQITWFGRLPRNDIEKYFLKAHLHVVTSMSEGNPTVVLEAMTYGVPTLTLDHCGMHDLICEECGFRIPVRNLADIVADIAGCIRNLLDNPEEIERHSRGVASCAARMTWEKRCADWQDFYHVATARWQKKADMSGSKL